MPHVTLAEITPELAPTVLALRVAPGQERLVSTVGESLEHAAREQEASAWREGAPR